MSQVVIENPILNSPFDEPTRHFRFDDDGITNEIVDGRRTSSLLRPDRPARRRRASSSQFDTEWTAGPHRGEQARQRHPPAASPCGAQGGYVGVTPTTARLLAYWTDPDREKKLFFCQIEALETAIYLTEVAKKYGDAWIENELREANDDVEPRPAAHRLQDGDRLRQDRRHGDAHRLADAQQARQPAGRPLLRHLPGRHARHHDPRPPARAAADRPGQLLPPARHRARPTYREQLGQAKIVITNFHAFQLREKVDAGKLTKSILADGQPSPFTETPDQMVRRVCRELGTKKNIIVLNDEAHHCYRRKPDGEDEKLTGDDRSEAKQRDEEARVWISGLEAVNAKIGVKADLRPVGHAVLPARLRLPRRHALPVGRLRLLADRRHRGRHRQGPARAGRRRLDDRRPAHLPRPVAAHPRRPAEEGPQDRRASAANRKLPAELRRGAAQPVRQLREVRTGAGKQNAEARATRQHAAGLHRRLQQHQRLQAGLRLHRRLGEDRSATRHVVQCRAAAASSATSTATAAGCTARTRSWSTAEQLESGEAMSAEFKKIAAREIDEFKAEYRARFPGRDADDLTDEDLLREVMNTVGKPGKLGEHVQCVVSASRCSPRAGTPTPSPTSSACAPSARSCCASRSSAAACAA